MGCLFAFLLFMLCPWLYYIWITRKSIDRMNDIYRKNQEESQRNNDTTQQPDNTRVTPSGKRPHVFKPGEGDYVEFSETKDNT